LFLERENIGQEVTHGTKKLGLSMGVFMVKLAPLIRKWREKRKYMKAARKI
jgi:hypothetical protein